jgi:hypothetical protein
MGNLGIPSRRDLDIPGLQAPLFRCAECQDGFLDWPGKPMQQSFENERSCGKQNQLPRHDVTGATDQPDPRRNCADRIA